MHDVAVENLRSVQGGFRVAYICRVIASIRGEDALDMAMSGASIPHRWQAKLESL